MTLEEVVEILLREPNLTGRTQGLLRDLLEKDRADQTDMDHFEACVMRGPAGQD